MIIILEGPDGSGKTTLAMKLAAALNYEVKHFSAPKTKEEQENLYVTYFRYLLAHDEVIIDRCWPSAVVYGKIMRTGPDISEVQIQHLERVFARDAIMIYCTGDPRVMWQRCQKRGEEYITDLDTYYRICQEYDCYMASHKFGIPTYKWVLNK